MRRGLLPRRQVPKHPRLSQQGPRTSLTNAVLATLSGCCPPPKGRLPTCYSPVRRFTRGPKPTFSLDLHVLSLPLTFALSQDQTLHLNSVEEIVLPGISSDLSSVTTGLAREMIDRVRYVLWFSQFLSLSSFQRPTDFGRLVRSPVPRRRSTLKLVVRPVKGIARVTSGRAVCLVYVSPSRTKWAWKDSNFRPHAYQACALNQLSYRPFGDRLDSSLLVKRPLLTGRGHIPDPADRVNVVFC
jgi:hypothetical protein